MESTSTHDGGASAEESEATAAAGTGKWVWQDHFRILPRNQGNFKVECKYCAGDPITGGATRFKKHLLGSGGVRLCSGVTTFLLR